MKLIPLAIMGLLVAVNLTAQIDSTFVRYYYPTTQTLPAWEAFPIGQTLAANVFEAYDGNFVLQTLATFHSPPPEWVFPQSPMMLYSRNGEYQSTLFGPHVDGDIVEGYYTRIVKDGLGGYLAVDSHNGRLHRLNSNLQYIENVTLTCDEGIIGYLRDFIPTNNGFVALGSIEGSNLSGMIKFNNNLVPQWRHLVSVYNSAFLDVVLNTDGGYLLWYGGYTYFNVVKVSANGDLLWVKSQVSPYVSKLLEINSRYYGLVYQSINMSAAEIQVYNYGIDFEDEHPVNPLIIIPTYPLLDQCFYDFGEPFCGIQTSDNGVILAISTPTSEIFKFDSNLNMLWSSNALINERTGVGKHPIFEMQNGDIVYAATVLSQYDMTERLAIVRIDSNGNYVGIVDEYETTPSVSCVSAYPNPFSKEITLSTKRRLHYPSKFTIYNIKGQQVESIDVNDKTVTWMPKDIPSGLYIVKLVEGSITIESHLISYIK